MSKSLPITMKAAVINKFGSAGEIKIQQVPVPELGENEVLIKVAYAGVGSWEPFEREGGYAKMQGTTPSFPYILGSEGSGVIVATGSSVTQFKAGDAVYAVGFLNPKGGFYAEYVAVDTDLVSLVPKQITPQAASGMGGVGMTGLRGLEDTLKLQSGESLLIFGASGAMGHLVIQLAKRIGAVVYAVASGQEGVDLAKKVGADFAVDGLSDDVVMQINSMVPNGVDTAFITAGGDVADALLSTVRDGGRVAFPTGVFPEPKNLDNLKITNFNGEPDRDLVKRFNKLIGADSFIVHVSKTYDLNHAGEAQEALTNHHLGKIILKIC